MIRTTDNYIKTGQGPYIKWTVALDTDGVTKLYTISVKETVADSPKQLTF